MKTIGERIVFLREELDMTQTKLAEKVGLTKMTLYKYEKNKCEPRCEVIARLSDALHTTSDFLIGRTNNPNPLPYYQNYEDSYQKNNELVYKFNQLSQEDKIRILERIDTLLEKYLDKSNG